MSLKAITKSWAKNIILSSEVLRLANQCTSPRAIILGYRSIQDRPELCANSLGLDITHAIFAFESQMELIARGYSPVSLEGILLFLQGGQ